jgi:hypothetical protein
MIRVDSAQFIKGACSRPAVIRRERGQLMGVAGIALIAILAITCVLVFTNCCLAIYYQTKLRHVSSVVAQSADLHCTPYWGVYGGDPFYLAQHDGSAVMQMIGIPFFGSFMPYGAIFTNAVGLTQCNFSPFRAACISMLDFFGNSATDKVQHYVHGDAGASANAHVGYLAVPTTRTPTQAGAAGHWEHATTTIYNVWLPIVKAPPIGSGVPLYSWYLKPTPLGTAYIEDSVSTTKYYPGIKGSIVGGPISKTTTSTVGSRKIPACGFATPPPGVFNIGEARYSTYHYWVDQPTQPPPPPPANLQSPTMVPPSNVHVQQPWEMKTVGNVLDPR